VLFGDGAKISWLVTAPVMMLIEDSRRRRRRRRRRSGE